MADDPKEPKEPSAKDEPKAPEPELGEAGKKALQQERRARKAAEKELEEIKARLQGIEDKDKSESDKLREAAATAEKKAQDAELRAMRLEVATEKGLTPAQAKRLVGATKEELESDADDFLESIKPDESGKPPGGKPQEQLRGGGDPTDTPEEMDPRKLADMVPRY
jgi:hypothetical protein